MIEIWIIILLAGTYLGIFIGLTVYMYRSTLSFLLILGQAARNGWGHIKWLLFKFPMWFVVKAERLHYKYIKLPKLQDKTRKGDLWALAERLKHTDRGKSPHYGE